MRKLKRKTLNRQIYIIIIVMAFGVLFFGVGYSMLSQKLSISGTTNIVATDVKAYNFTYSSTKWYGNKKYNYTFTNTITNLGKYSTNGWTVIINVPTDVTSVTCGNATCTLANNKITATNLSTNKTILPNGSTDFTFQIATSNDSLVLTYVVVNNIVVIDMTTGGQVTTGITVTPTLVRKTNYTSYYIHNYRFLVTNNSGVNLSSWSFKFTDSNASITSITGGNYVNANGVFTISNTASNGNLKSKNSVTVTANIKTVASSFVPTIHSILGIAK